MTQDLMQDLRDIVVQVDGVIELEQLTDFAALRDCVIRARRLRVPWIIFPWKTRDRYGYVIHRHQVAIKPLSCPDSLLDRRKKVNNFANWVFQTRIY